MITCDCSVDIASEEAPVVFREAWKLARREHQCCECDAPIRVGERHEVVTGLWDGAWSTYRTCRVCAAIRVSYCSCGWIYGELRERLWDCLGMDYVTGEADDRRDEVDR